MTGPILIADLGGSNLRFAIAANGDCVNEHAFPAERFPDLEAAIDAYADTVGSGRLPDRAVFAVAGPPDGETIAFTNRDWRTPIATVRARFTIAQVKVINDFAAVAHALPYIDAAHLRALGPDRTADRAPMVVLGPGTGLGVACALPEQDGWRVIPGEGGHATLAAQNETEDKVVAYLRGLHGHVSAERALSGPGLADLHDAVRAVQGLPGRPLTPEQVTAEAANDPVCAKVIDLFTGFLATVAGDLALTLNARGGVFIAGGIVPRLGELFDGGRFRRRFTTKGRLAGYLDPMPTRLITLPQPALLGLAKAADRLLNSSV
jgi:glucokinase